MKIAVYPGSFDPFTLGHKDILLRSSKIFDKVIVAIGENHGKQNLFSVDERINDISSEISDIGIKDNVIVLYEIIKLNILYLLFFFCRDHFLFHKNLYCLLKL